MLTGTTRFSFKHSLRKSGLEGSRTSSKEVTFSDVDRSRFSFKQNRMLHGHTPASWPATLHKQNLTTTLDRFVCCRFAPTEKWFSLVGSFPRGGQAPQRCPSSRSQYNFPVWIWLHRRFIFPLFIDYKSQRITTRVQAKHTATRQYQWARNDRSTSAATSFTKTLVCSDTGTLTLSSRSRL